MELIRLGKQKIRVTVNAVKSTLRKQIHQVVDYINQVVQKYEVILTLR